MNKRQAQRLLRVAKALRESPLPKAFDMNTYVMGGPETLFNLEDAGLVKFDHDTYQFFDKKTGKLLKEENFCGTPACALGHYGARGDLQRLMKVGVRQGAINLLYHANYNNRTVSYDDDTVQEHFGITEEQATDLFDGDGCGGARTPIEAAKYIEKFVKQIYGQVSL